MQTWTSGTEHTVVLSANSDIRDGTYYSTKRKVHKSGQTVHNVPDHLGGVQGPLYCLPHAKLHLWTNSWPSGMSCIGVMAPDIETLLAYIYRLISKFGTNTWDIDIKYLTVSLIKPTA